MAAPQSRTITWLLAATSVLAVVILARRSSPLFREQARGVTMVRAAQRQLADLRQEDERAACASHLSALGQLLDAYAHRSDNAKRLLPESLQQAVSDGDRGILSCPVGAQPYIYLGKGRDTGTLGSGFVTVYEPITAHEDGAHFLFADRHVEWMDKARAETVIRQLETGHNPP
jgi:hypothetical protein